MSLFRPLAGRSLGGRSLAGRALANDRTITPAQGVGRVLGPLSPIISTLQAGVDDINLLWIGDSTSAENHRMAKPLMEAIAPDYPEYTVVYVPPDAAGGYGTPVTIQVGTGSPTMTLYNNSVSAQAPEYFMAGKYTGAFITPGATWDAVIWNHGKNLAAGANVAITEGELAGAILQVMVDFPNAQHIIIDQYPNRDDTNMDLVSSCWQDIVAYAPQIGRINLKTGTTWVSGDYNDNQHASDAAYTAKVNPLIVTYWNQHRAGAWAPETAWDTISSTNLLRGPSNEDAGNFELDGTSGSVVGAADAVPYLWANSGTVTYTKDATVTYRGGPRSQKMQGSGAAQTRMSKGLHPAGLNAAKGQRCWLVSIQQIEAGAAGTVGRFAVTSNGTGALSLTSRSSSTNAQGAMRVRVLGPFTPPTDMTIGTVIQYHDTAASPDATHALNVVKLILTASPMPRLAA